MGHVVTLEISSTFRGLPSRHRRDKGHEGENTKIEAEIIRDIKRNAKGLEDKEKSEPKKKGCIPLSPLVLRPLGLKI
jgi:hypothetical protein